MKLLHTGRRKSIGLVTIVIVGVALVAGFVVMTSGTGTADQSISGLQVQAIGNVRIREEPGVTSTRIGALEWGENAYVKGVDVSGLWYRIEANGMEGWVAADWFLTVNQNQARSSSEPLTSPTGVVVRALDGTRIRAQPGLRGTRLGIIPWGGQAALLSVSQSGQWYQIDYEGTVGWSAAQWFQVEDGDLSSVKSVEPLTHVRALGNIRIRANPSLDGEIIGMIYTGNHALVIGTDASGQWHQINFRGTIGWSAAEWFEADPDYVEPIELQQEALARRIRPGTVLIQLGEDLVQIHDTPDDSSGTAGVVRNQGHVTLLATDESGMWYQIVRDGVFGWVQAAPFQSTGRVLLEIPAPSEDAPTTPKESSQAGAVLGLVEAQFDDVPLRSIPETGGEIVVWLNRGDEAAVLEVDESGDWYHLQAGELTGWAHTIWFESIEASAPADAQQVASQFDDVPLRVVPQTGGEIIVWLNRGDEAAVLEVDESGEWYRLQVGSAEGWAHRIWFELLEASAPADSQQVESQYDDVPLRLEPRTGGEIVVWLNRGDEAAVLEVDKSGEWYRLQVGSAEGWARSTWFEAVESGLSDTGETSLVDGQVVSQFDDVPLLAAPETGSERIMWLGSGDQASVLETDGDWFRLQVGDAEGWAHTIWFTTIEVNAQQVVSQFDDVPVQQSPETGSEILAWLGRGDQVTVLEADGNWYRVQYGDVTGWARSIWFSGIDVSLPDDAQQVESQYDDVPLRLEPQTGGEIVVWLARGDEAVVLGTDESNEWYHLQADGGEGWARSIWFTTVDPQPKGIGVGSKVISDGTAVRIQESPDVGSFTENVIKRGETAEVLAVDESGMWYQIDFEGQIGWSAAEWFSLVEE